MLISTKRYQVGKKTYIMVALAGVLRQQWWVFPCALAPCFAYFFIPSFWWMYGVGIALALYFLFWFVQFAGITRLEQFKMLFDKVSYEITSANILMKFTTKRGMPIKWDQIRRIRKTSRAYVLFISKAQFLYLPFHLFKNDNELRFLETILVRKKLK